LSNRPDLVAAAAEYREKGYLVRDFGFSEADLAGAADYTRSIPTARVLLTTFTRRGLFPSRR
jgi:hypothetical protein